MALPECMFTLTPELIEQIAAAVARHLPKVASKRWPELMLYETAGEYIDRTDVAIRHLVAKNRIARVEIDTKPQIAKSDLDRLIIENRF